MNEAPGRGLRLPQTLPLGAGKEQARKVSEEWNTIDAVHEEVHLRGLVDHEQPQYACPELTADMLTTTDSKSYTETYAQLLAWFSYASEVFAVVQSTILQLENMRDILGAESRRNARELQTGPKKITKEELGDRLLLNPEYQDVLKKLQRFEQAKLLYQAKVESIERSLRVISRQVEIRRLDMEQHRTGTGIGNRGFAGQNRFGMPERG